MSIQYRSASLADAGPIAELHAGSWRATYRGSYADEYLDGPLVEERLRVWTDRLGAPASNQYVVVAQEELGIVGFACAYGGHDDSWGSFLDNLHAHPDRHREGIGSHLFASVVAWCRKHYPACGLYLSVVAQNVNARRFYEALGGIDGGGTRPSSPWLLGTVEIRRYVWPTLDDVVLRKSSEAERRTTR